MKWSGSRTKTWYMRLWSQASYKLSKMLQRNTNFFLLLNLHDGVKLSSSGYSVLYSVFGTTDSIKSVSVTDTLVWAKIRYNMSARHTSRELANKYVGPLDTASFSGVSHCQRIHWSWKKMRIQVFSSFVFSCVPFCSFCFSFCGFSVSFSSSSSPLHQMRSRTCCVSFSSLWSHHSKKNQICRVENKKTKTWSLKGHKPVN